MPAPAALGHGDPIPDLLEVAEEVAPVAIADDRSGRNFDYQVVGPLAEAVGALAVLAAFGLPVPL